MRAKVIAVGGSNGKTTTKRIIHALLSEKFEKGDGRGGSGGGHVSPKSFNNNIGMPLTLLEVETSHEFVVLEIGTNAPGEIAALGEVCRPDIAVISRVSGWNALEQGWAIWKGWRGRRRRSHRLWRRAGRWYCRRMRPSCWRR